MAHAVPDLKHIKANEPGACQHCGALVFGDTLRCSQCGRFPIRIHSCPRCKAISSAEAEACWKCGRMFVMDGDFL
jgi:RNA polymerase subunit RPABC4/transcription elongation factor Spt4